MSTISNKTTNQIAIHVVPSLTRRGYWCKKWPMYEVVVGSDPYGPRGGTCGNWGDGKVVARFRTRQKAEEFVAATTCNG